MIITLGKLHITHNTDLKAVFFALSKTLLVVTLHNNIHILIVNNSVVNSSSNSNKYGYLDTGFNTVKHLMRLISMKHSTNKDIGCKCFT